MEFRDVLAALRHGWWLAVMGVVIGGLAALGVSLLMTPRYSAETQLFVSTDDSSSTSAVFQGSQFSQDRVSSYAELLGGEELATRVVAALDLNMSPGQLMGGIEVSTVPQTVLLNVTVTDPSPQQARLIAEEIATQFPEMVTELETTSSGASPVRVAVVHPPVLPSVPSSPQTLLNVILGALVGLLLGAVAAISRDRLDRSVKKPEDAAE